MLIYEEIKDSSGNYFATNKIAGSFSYNYNKAPCKDLDVYFMLIDEEQLEKVKEVLKDYFVLNSIEKYENSFFVRVDNKEKTIESISVEEGRPGCIEACAQYHFFIPYTGKKYPEYLNK